MPGHQIGRKVDLLTNYHACLWNGSSFIPRILTPNPRKLLSKEDPFRQTLNSWRFLTESDLITLQKAFPSAARLRLHIRGYATVMFDR